MVSHASKTLAKPTRFPLIPSASFDFILLLFLPLFHQYHHLCTASIKKKLAKYPSVLIIGSIFNTIIDSQYINTECFSDVQQYHGKSLLCVLFVQFGIVLIAFVSVVDFGLLYAFGNVGLVLLLC